MQRFSKPSATRGPGPSTTNHTTADVELEYQIKQLYQLVTQFNREAHELSTWVRSTTQHPHRHPLTISKARTELERLRAATQDLARKRAYLVEEHGRLEELVSPGDVTFSRERRVMMDNLRRVDVGINNTARLVSDAHEAFVADLRLRGIPLQQRET